MGADVHQLASSARLPRDRKAVVDRYEVKLGVFEVLHDAVGAHFIGDVILPGAPMFTEREVMTVRVLVVALDFDAAILRVHAQPRIGLATVEEVELRARGS